MSIFAPEGGWVVRILDLSAPHGDNVTEEIRGFPSLMQANEFARRYVRDSLERCRAPDLSPAEIVTAWMEFGEDAEVVDGGEDGFASGAEIGNWAKFPCDEEERNWRALDPRQSEE